MNAKLMKLSREGSSHTTDSHNLKLKERRNSLETKGRGIEEMSRSREDFIANAKSQPCMFYAKGYCMRGNSCWFNHKGPEQMPFAEAGADVMANRSFDEELPTSRESRHILLRLMDFTVTVKTLDIEPFWPGKKGT